MDAGILKAYFFFVTIPRLSVGLKEKPGDNASGE
jgi:hypothetical protein